MSSITDAGFIKTRLDERLATLETAVRAIFGSDIDLGVESPDGQQLGIFAEALADLDDLSEAIYNGRSPAGASGAGLARLVQLNGLRRNGAQYSAATVALGGIPGTPIPEASLVTHNTDPTVVFQTVAPYTIGGGGTVNATMRASSTGPIRAPAGKLTLVTTVISGWTSANNVADASVGNDGETDPALRLRRSASVALPSQGIIDGLYAALLQVADVKHARVYENPTDIIDSNGLPRHSIQCIVQGGDPVEIANTIWLKKSVGVTQVGAITQDITDLQNVPHTMRFDAPVATPIWTIIHMAVDPDTATQNLIKAAIVAWGLDHSDIGSDVIWSQLFIPINTFAGLSILNLYIGLAPSPSAQANLAIPFNAIATWDPSRISFT